MAGTTYQPSPSSIHTGAALGDPFHNEQRSLEERRVVTILFCDVTGSTAMAEQLDPEDWAEVMREAFGILIQPVERYGGIVARLMGDAIMAFFGAPRAHEDDPQRAVLAALDIQDGIQPLRRRMQATYGLDFNVRIGINTGTVVVGEFGSAQAYEYTAMGDAINLASRMEQTAEPGTIQVAETTYKMTAPFFKFEERGELDIRGKRGAVPVFRVLGRTSAPGRLWDFAGLNPPLVGRRAELEVLRYAFDRLRAGHGQIISLIGEAGLGKTRLIDELRTLWENYEREQSDDPTLPPVAWLENRLIAHEALQPYGALQQRLRQAFHLERSDSVDVIQHKIEQTLAHFPEEIRQRAARMTELVLSIDGSGNDVGRRAGTKLDSAEARAELYELMLLVLRGWARGGAMIYVVEDTHLIDKASAELFVHVIQLAAQIPILFVCSYRPQQSSEPWRIRDAAQERFPALHRELRLQPLSADEAGALVDSLIAASPDSAELRELVMRKADGNPLFVEEIVRALIERGALTLDNSSTSARWTPTCEVPADSIEVPDTLHSLLLDRLDRLDLEARRILQQAAVLGRTFPKRLLAEIAEANGSLDAYLQQLTQAELLAASSHGDEYEYSFRHTMIWEVAYGTILKRHRRLFHLRAGEAIERLHPDRLEEYAHTLGNHYLEAGDPRGIDWLLRAAKRAQALFEPRSVIAFVNDAEQLAAQHERPAPVAGIRMRGHAFEMTGEYEEARAEYERAVEISRETGDTEEEWQALIELGMLWTERDYQRAGEHYQAALALAQRLNDSQKLAHSLNRIGNWHANVGRRQDAIDAHQQALAIFEDVDDAGGRAQTLDYLGVVSYLSGDVRHSAAYNREAETLFRKLNDPRGMASTLAIMTFAGGSLNSEAVAVDPEAALHWRRKGEESLDAARAIGWRAGEAFALLAMALATGVRGMFGESLELAEAARTLADRIGHRQWLAASLYTLGHLRLELLDHNGAEPLLREALSLASSNGSEYWTWSSASTLSALHRERGELDQAWQMLRCPTEKTINPDSLAGRRCWYHRARLLIDTGKPDQAQWIATELRKRAGADVVPEDMPEVALLMATALRQGNQLADADRELVAARRGAETLGFRPVLRRVELEQAQLALANGSRMDAEAALNASHQVALELAGELVDPTDRQRYLLAVSAQETRALAR